MSQTLTIYLVAGLAFISILGIGFAFTTGTSSAASTKRLKQIKTAGEGGKSASTDVAALRRKQMQDSVKNLRDKEAKRRKDQKAVSIAEKLEQAGWSMPVATFWVMSAVLGVVGAVGAFFAGFGLSGTA
jgi:tight adherence protein B